MGLLDDAASVVTRKPSRGDGYYKSHSYSHSKRHRSRSRSKSRSRRSSSHGFFGLGNTSRGSFFGGNDSHYHKHNSSRSSFFGLGNNASRSSFFGGFGRSPSYYKRSPRSGFLERTYKQLKRLLRDLVYYAKRHPYKVFMLVIMPLITGGALTALLARFGLRLPPNIERMLGLAAATASGDHRGLVGEAVRMAAGGDAYGSVKVERGRDGGMQWERKSVNHDGWGDGGFFSGIGRMFS